jgi:GMP synthase (glutamine-hydrolysing)
VDSILILDFGSQYTQLIGRRVRELGVYAEIAPGDSPLSRAVGPGTKGIILSGSPFSSYEEGAPGIDPGLWSLGLPTLGICYGAQRMALDLGGEVRKLGEREYGRKPVAVERATALFAGFPASFVSWMSHGDSIVSPAPGFEVVAKSEGGIIAAVADEGRRLWGVQFHPEVTHCELGKELLANFALGVCGAKPEWNMRAYVDLSRDRLAGKIGSGDALLLISGGVDSTVAGALLLECLDPDRVHLMYIDTGLMRKGESAEVRKNLESLGAKHLHVIEAEAEFLEALAGLSDPEAKRKAIGDAFVKVQTREVERLGIPDSFLVQGTLYTDLVESGLGVGKKAQVIKSHHNVRSPLIEAKRAAGKVVEPLDMCYKDEVRELGRILGVAESIVSRHPFPGPGLGVRILGEVSREKCDILREADAIFIEELKARGLYDRIWQAFSVLLPIRSVGVAGDERKYGFVLALRAVASVDGMTAEPFAFDMKDLIEISSAITNRVPMVGRVTYDVSSKPPATIEWE